MPATPAALEEAGVDYDEAIQRIVEQGPCRTVAEPVTAGDGCL